MPCSAKGPRFAWVSGDAIFDPDLTRLDIVVFAALATFADKNGFCVRSQVKLANELRMARTTLIRSIKRLVASGWLLITKGERPDGGRCSHTYRVLRKKTGEAEPELEASSPPARSRDFELQNGHGLSHTRNNHKNNLQKTKKEEDKPAESTADLEQGREGDGDRNPVPEQDGRAQGEGGKTGTEDAERQYVERAVQALALVGLDLTSGDLHGGAGPLSAWYRAGYDLQHDILPAVLRVLKKAPSRVRSLKYFNRAVMAAHRARLDAAQRCTRDVLDLGSTTKRDLAHQRAMDRALMDF